MVKAAVSSEGATNRDWTTTAYTGFAAGLVAAVVEIAVVFLIQGTALHAGPVLILQSIASGLLGQRAYLGGPGTAALGGVLHTLISIVAACAFAWCAGRRPLLTANPVRSGLAFGVVVWALMSYLVVPLSAAAFGQARAPILIAVSLAVHMFAFGLPIALVCSRMLADAGPRSRAGGIG